MIVRGETFGAFAANVDADDEQRRDDPDAKPERQIEHQPCRPVTDRQRALALTWAQRLKRVFAIEIETCRRCGGRLRVIASIEAPTTIERILAHLSRDAEPVDPAYPGRA